MAGKKGDWEPNYRLWSVMAYVILGVLGVLWLLFCMTCHPANFPGGRWP